VRLHTDLAAAKQRNFRIPDGKWVTAILVMVALALPVSYTLLHSLKTSPIDEWVYIDYTDRVFQQGRALEGDVASRYTTDIMACYGVLPGGTFGTCGLGETAALPYGGHPTGSPYMPIYFWITASVGGVIRLATGIEPLIAWRLTGALWLAAAMLVYVRLSRLWRVPDAATLALGGLLIASPYVWTAHSFISTDARSLLIGASLLMLATQIRRGKLHAAWLILAAPLAVALKITNLVAVGLAVMYLLIAWASDAVRSRRAGDPAKLRPLIGRIAIVTAGIAAAGLMQVLWLRFVNSTAATSYRADQGVATPLGKGELINQALNFLPGAITSNPFITASYYAQAASGLSWFLITAVLGSFLRLNKWGARGEMVTSVAIASVLAAPALAILLHAVTGSYFQLPSRYGASLIPAFLLMGGFLIRNRVALWLLGAYALALGAIAVALSVYLH